MSEKEKVVKYKGVLRLDGERPWTAIANLFEGSERDEDFCSDLNLKIQGIMGIGHPETYGKEIFVMSIADKDGVVVAYLQIPSKFLKKALESDRYI